MKTKLKTLRDRAPAAAFILCFALMITAGGCTGWTGHVECGMCTYDQYTGFSLTSQSDSCPGAIDGLPGGSGGYVTYHDDITPVAEWFLECGGFEYEKAAAKFYYSGTAEGVTVSGSYRSDQLRSRGRYGFDGTGFGAFVLTDMNRSEEDMSLVTFYIEYTTDFGESWHIYDSGFESEYYPYDVAVNDGKLYIFRRSAVRKGSYIMYTGDKCSSFRSVSVPAMLPQYGVGLTDVLGDIELMNIDGGDNSLLLGWRSSDRRRQAEADEYTYNWGRDGWFLIVKADGTLHTFSVVYSDSEYIRERTETLG